MDVTYGFQVYKVSFERDTFKPAPEPAHSNTDVDDLIVSAPATIPYSLGRVLSSEGGRATATKCPASRARSGGPARLSKGRRNPRCAEPFVTRQTDDDALASPNPCDLLFSS